VRLPPEATGIGGPRVRLSGLVIDTTEMYLRCVLELEEEGDLPGEASCVVVRRIGEPVQSDTALLTQLRHVGFQPDAAIPVCRSRGQVRIGTGQQAVDLDDAAAAHLFVTISAGPAANGLWPCGAYAPCVARSLRANPPKAIHALALRVAARTVPAVSSQAAR
jgi:hypothetical protein